MLAEFPDAYVVTRARCVNMMMAILPRKIPRVDIGPVPSCKMFLYHIIKYHCYHLEKWNCILCINHYGVFLCLDRDHDAKSKHLINLLASSDVMWQQKRLGNHWPRSWLNELPNVD